MIHWNWIIFGILYLILYFSDKILKKIFFKEKDFDKINKINKDLKRIKIITYKTLDQQKKYLALTDESNNMFGDFFNKIIFLIFMIIIYFIGMDYFTGYLIIPYSIIFSILCSLMYTYKKEYKAYNFFSMFFMLIFFTSFISIQMIDPLYFYSVRVKIFYIIPFMILIPILIGLIQEKIFKRRKEVNIK